LARIQRLGGGSFALNGGPQGVEAALIPNVFLGDAGGNRLSAFKAGRRVEEGALLATVQLEATLWTTPLDVDPDRQEQRAGGTPRNLALPGHVRGPRPDLLSLGQGLFLGPLTPTVRVHVSPLSVLTVHPYSFRGEESLSAKDIRVAATFII